MGAQTVPFNEEHGSHVGDLTLVSGHHRIDSSWTGTQRHPSLTPDVRGDGRCEVQITNEQLVLIIQAALDSMRDEWTGLSLSVVDSQLASF